MDIYFSPSLADMRKKLEMAEDKINERNAAAQEQQAKIAQEQMQQQAAIEQAKMQQEEMQHQRDDATKRYIAELQASMKDAENVDANNDGIVDRVAEEKLALDRDKAKNDQINKMRQLDDAMKMHNDKMQREDKKIAAAKAKPTSSK